MSREKIKNEIFRIDLFLKYNPQYNDFLKKKLRHLIILRNFNDALTVADELLKLDKQDRNILEEKAFILYKLGRNQEARKVIETVIYQFPIFESTTYELWGDICYKLKDYVRASEAYQNALDTTGNEDVDVLLKLGKSLFQYEDESYTSVVFKKVLEKDKTNSEAWTYLGILFFDFDMNEWQRLKHKQKFFNNALRSNPKNQFALFEKGKICLELGSFLEALAVFDRLVRLKPNHRLGLIYMVASLIKIGNYSVAKEIIKTMPGCNKDPVLRILSGLCDIRLGKNEKGLAKIRSISDGYFLPYSKNIDPFRMFPESIQFDIFRTICDVEADKISLLRLGILFYHNDLIEKALECFKKCTMIDRDYFSGWIWKAEANRVLNDYESAILDIKEAIRIDHKNNQAKWIERKIMRNLSNKNNLPS